MGQGRLGAGTYAGQAAADLMRARQNQTVATGPQSLQDFGAMLRAANQNNPFGQTGAQALANAQFLAKIGTGGDFGSTVPSFVSTAREYINPWSQDELQSQQLADHFTAAFQGAGVSPLWGGNVSRGDIQQQYSRFAGMNPNLGQQGQDLAQSFFNYLASDVYGIDQFAP